ncbi:MAG: hypothetical protein C3F07_10805 [Anaerolineales bacterium]|nr:hypothetical protein [Anaerolineae bacterium]PWB72902.1 MAG: hypothetical protein C3F07_10805 [Anaerolineales bacterium]
MELLERASQLQLLQSALDQAQAGEGQGCVALVYGEAGIGKTSLVEHFVNEHKPKWRILRGACDSLFTPRPLGPLHDIALQSQGQLLRLLESESNRTAIFSACLNELQEQATILVIEDIHWADEATLDLLKYLGRRIRQTISLMILTYRDDEIGVGHPLRILLGDIASSQALYRVPVTHLSGDAVQELAKDRDVDPFKLHRLTNGNPFFVTEVLAGEGGIPETARDAVLARAARLSASAREVLEAAAVIGSKVEPWLLSEVSGADGAFTDECISMGMLQSHDAYYSFRHELARQMILESISPQRKIELHRLTLDALRESPETQNDFARLVDHAEGAINVEAILEFVPLAGRQASALGAHRQSYAHYKTALQYADLLPLEERAELFDCYADECEAIVLMTEAEHAEREALRLWQELGQGEKEGRALRRLSEIVMQQNKRSEMYQYVSEAISVLEKHPPSKELAIAYSHRSRMHMIVYEVEETYRWGNRAIELAEKIGDIETLAHALTNIGIVEMWHDQLVEGQQKLERSLQLSLEHDYQVHAARAYQNLTDGLLVARDYAGCLAYANDGLEYCSRHDLDNTYIGLLGDRARAKFEQGLWDETEMDIKLSQGFTATMGMSSSLGLLEQKLIVRRGEPLDAQEIEKLRMYAHTAIFHVNRYPIAEMFAELAWLQGDLVQCRAEVELMFNYALQLKIPTYVGALGYWMWRAGAMPEPPPDSAEPYATQISGDWRTAASMWEKYGCPYEQGMALMDGDEAAQLQALEIFKRLGARPIIEKLKRQMQTQGIRVPRGPRPATRKNRFGLTSREMEVLGQLVKGLSNPAIAKSLNLSTRTVEHHIASILQKMQAESRNEAAARALQENLFPAE